MVLTRANGGLALGLFLAERAVAALGGRLELKSAPGQGTAAAVVLPATPPSPG
jgi:signal transduction histidine kinase